jgi:hypothetical protein
MLDIKTGKVGEKKEKKRERKKTGEKSNQGDFSLVAYLIRRPR